MDQEIAAKRPGDQSMDKSAEIIMEQTPDLRGQGGSLPVSMDKKTNGLVTKLMTYLKVAGVHGGNPKRFNSTDFLLTNGGEGRFCNVFICCDKETQKEVGVKIFKDNCKKEDIDREVSMLEEIGLGKPFSKFTVKFLKQCEHNGQTCLVFERLERTTKEFVQIWGRSLQLARVWAIQLFLALDELKAADILHCDIHPGNIMFVNNKKQPSHIQLIDFGSAIKSSDAEVGMELQTLEYRAPEILLGLPFTEAIDMWGVGCTLAFVCLGENLFSASSENQMVKRILELLGQPEDHLLRSGKYTERYFVEEEAADGPVWTLKKPGEQNYSTDQLSSLEDIFKLTEYKMESYQEYEDRVAFVDLLKQMLHVDANQRISVRQALKHPFITMDHMINHFEGPGIFHHWASEEQIETCPALSEYLQDKSKNWTPFQEFPVLTTYWDQEGRIILHSSSSSYTVLEKIGRGMFGYVLRCQNRTTKEEVAVKIPKQKYSNEESTGHELAIFEKINARNPDSKYIIKLFEQCEYLGRTCLVFEILDRSLGSQILENKNQTLRSIRPIAKQLFLALEELETLNIQHGDLHEDNIMFVNKQDNRVKFIDFGSAIIDEPLKVKYNENTDISNVGQCLANLYFIGLSTNALEREPEGNERQEGDKEKSEKEESESVHSQVEPSYQVSENYSSGRSSTDSDEQSVDLMTDKEFEDRVAFKDLLRQTMNKDLNLRISPSQALQHPFITMDHLINRFEIRDYLEASQAIMNECPMFSRDTVKGSSG